MDPILENESATTESSSKHGKNKHRNKKKKSNQEMQNENQTVVGEKKKFVVTTLSGSNEQNISEGYAQSNVHTIHFGTRGAESQRPHVRSIFKDRPPETSRPSSAERDQISKGKEYETFHGTSSSPRSSIFDIFRIRRKSDSKKHQSLIQNVKGSLAVPQKSAESPVESTSSETKDSHKKYYYTVTGVSSRKSSPITRVMDIFRSKPHPQTEPSTADNTKKKSSKSARRSSIGTTSPTYHKNSYASLDPVQAKQLFREVRGLPKYDPYLSIVQISIGVRKTFPTLVSHGIRSAPLWDANKKLLVGMITVTDFIRILLHLDKENLSMEDLEKHTLHNWKKILRPTRKPLCSVGPDESLHEAINMLSKNRVHRLLMIDPVSGDVLYILSHKRILRFLFVYLNEFPELTFFHKTLLDLNIGTFDGIISVTDDTSVKEAFQLLLDNDISALPILDENGVLLNVYPKYEVLNLVSEKLYLNLSLTIGDVRNKKKDWEEKLQKCSSTITLYEALEIIVRTESHRLLLVNKDDKLAGVVSLSDILVYLNRIIPAEKKVSSLQEIFRPLEVNKVPESLKESENEVITINVPIIATAQNVPELNEANDVCIGDNSNETNINSEIETNEQSAEASDAKDAEADADVQQSQTDVAVDNDES
ncbi:putative AMP-activated protein kinase gamma regulatory subunit [Danaus plexippus plexippus]|uniref:AMP-activated protein kinase gamma regulatory subunit n=1 Tax=Danaus plexippus plexippus TaxID=278856 RepID=A0A212EHU2_DANPL|nr:putative AMP-activated protein kinase gamma regulatory subunit [Danaus plexippus plexippus]